MWLLWVLHSGAGILVLLLQALQPYNSCSAVSHFLLTEPKLSYFSFTQEGIRRSITSHVFPHEKQKLLNSSPLSWKTESFKTLAPPVVSLKAQHARKSIKRSFKDTRFVLPLDWTMLLFFPGNSESGYRAIENPEREDLKINFSLKRKSILIFFSLVTLNILCLTCLPFPRFPSSDPRFSLIHCFQRQRSNQKYRMGSDEWMLAATYWDCWGNKFSCKEHKKKSLNNNGSVNSVTREYLVCGFCYLFHFYLFFFTGTS